MSEAQTLRYQFSHLDYDFIISGEGAQNPSQSEDPKVSLVVTAGGQDPPSKSDGFYAPTPPLSPSSINASTTTSSRQFGEAGVVKMSKQVLIGSYIVMTAFTGEP